jgi:HD superfamily phosphodiesterase
MMLKGEHIDMTSHAGMHSDREQTAAWSEWSSRRLTQMRVLHEAGLLGPENKEWRNIAEHSVVVNATAMYVAQELTNSGVPIDLALVDEASVLHDVTKRLEREAGVSYATEHGSTIKRDFLKKFHYSDKVVDATEYTGRVPEMLIEDPGKQAEAIDNHSLEELIVAYADARVRNTDIVPLEMARDLNKKKVPKDEAIYDKWYTFYKNVEGRLFSYIQEDITPDSLTNDSVMEMVKKSQQV